LVVDFGVDSDWFFPHCLPGFKDFVAGISKIRAGNGGKMNAGYENLTQCSFFLVVTAFFQWYNFHE